MRVEQIGDATLYLGDCLEILPTLGKVDAVVTDPPYGIGFKYENNSDRYDDYGEWLWNILEIAEKKCNPGAVFFVWQAMKNIREFAKWFPREWRVFAAAKNFVQMRPDCPMQYSYDPVVVWWIPGNIWTDGTLNRDFHIANTSPSSRKNTNADVKGHPCPRPLQQIQHIVSQWAKPNTLVLDPFMGSGTTGVACANLDRKFIGIEIEPKYFDIACKRIEQAQQQLKLAI